VDTRILAPVARNQGTGSRSLVRVARNRRVGNHNPAPLGHTRWAVRSKQGAVEVVAVS
jgi:hypothetical protein